MYKITDEDYAIVENDTSALQGVKLKKGEWKDVIVIYGQVGVKESPELDIATLSFNFTIKDPANFTIDELNKDEAFKNYLGAVLQYIITDSLENGGHIGKSTTNTHTESSSTQ